jgi:hypothetical protein
MRQITLLPTSLPLVPNPRPAYISGMWGLLVGLGFEHSTSHLKRYTIRASQSFCVIFTIGLLNYLPWLASNCGPPDLLNSGPHAS